VKKHVCIVLGSNGKNLNLANLFKNQLETNSMKVSLIDLVEANLPLYTRAQKTPGSEVLKPFMEALSAESFIFIAPEYNGGIPPVVTNFLAWASTSAKDWRQLFNGKSAALATHSGGDGYLFLAQMRLQLSYIGMNVLGRQLNINDRKEVDPKSIADIIQQL
jgi:NAD(P)H-dependent FMN reductase